MIRRRDVLKLAGAIAAAVTTGGAFSRCRTENWALGNSDHQSLAANAAIAAAIQVDWTNAIAQSTPFTFGSNDYEITEPEKASDRVYQRHLANLGVGLIRIHHAELCDRWTDPARKTWDAAKIKAGYDASFPQRPTIIQNIPKWPNWLAASQDGVLELAEHDRYASFCAELVEILNHRQQRNVQYWEPLNERDIDYDKAWKLDQLWTLYNQVAPAMKAKDPRIKVGGPALAWDNSDRMAAFLKTCGAHVDFISWHRYCSRDAQEPTDRIMAYTPEYGNQVRMFQKLVAQLVPNRRIPLLLGEYNINYQWDSGENRQNTHIGAVWFASVFKHLAEAGIDMATSWHLKDGIYGIIDPDNHLRPAATVFAWATRYLIGQVVLTKSDHPEIEAFAVWQAKTDQSLLLINKAAEAATVRVDAIKGIPNRDRLTQLSLDASGTKTSTLMAVDLARSPLTLAPYSLTLLRLADTAPQT